MTIARRPDDAARAGCASETRGPGARIEPAGRPREVVLDTSVNGRAVTLSVEPEALLLDVLRERLGLTGAKRSCDVQVCGACTVLLDGAAVRSCLVFAVQADGCEIGTV